MKFHQIICIGLIILGAAGVALAAEPAPVRELSPMMMEIKANVEAARLEVADLKLRYESAADNETAMEIMREVSRVKKESRVEMMRIQLRYARQEGREEAVVKLEAAITRMTTPPLNGVPVSRVDQKQ